MSSSITEFEIIDVLENALEQTAIPDEATVELYDNQQNTTIVRVEFNDPFSIDSLGMEMEIDRIKSVPEPRDPLRNGINDMEEYWFSTLDNVISFNNKAFRVAKEGEDPMAVVINCLYCQMGTAITIHDSCPDTIRLAALAKMHCECN